MTTRILSGLALLLLTLGSSSSCKRASASTSNDPLVIHEWGTFTSFQGADGVSLEGLQHETEALPEFVHSRLNANAAPLSVYGDPSRDVPVRECRGKMETPVIYFHTKTPRHVKVQVGYPQGLLTQWYPKASSATPTFTGAEEHSLTNVSMSELVWDLDLTPKGASHPLIPNVSAESDWQKAREVDAAYVSTRGGKTENEQYVFYRGLARTVPQPSITSSTNASITVTNASNETLHAAFMLEMREGGDGRFASLGSIAPGAHPSSLASVAFRPKAEVVLDVTRSMQAALVAEGLFEDEARAMVRTWSEPWFSSKGTRVLYLVPRSVTDTTLPMNITPAPDRLVRVMVGRVEYLTPEKQAEVARDVIDGGGSAFENPEARGAALGRLAMLGRFAEPATRAAASSTDPRMRDRASRVLGIVARRP